ncbi:hypothetical protein BUALT_Bualt02G0110100 [Buddleja alternifolia]|uniref:Uncharacterized protein n=1 Tax=Buddleja alternifolia TaxID=168488 RepID=A0AAV6XZS6_9LAMI|nr:hypothetical protein BUALT_Bualt02G0110100 [Buddleja alternifolia]
MSCLQSFNCPLNIIRCVSKDTRKKNHYVEKLSTIGQEEESYISSFSNKLSTGRSFSGPITGQANGIGIIGGLSVDSTLDFAKKLVKFDLEDEENGLPFILCSDPSLSKELLSLIKSSSPFLSGKNEGEHVDHRLIVENLRCKRVFLEKSGVCCVVMPCHISHSWYDEIREGCSIPFLHMGECVANELKEAKLRPLEAGSTLRVGVLATNATLVGGFYKEKLENEGFEVILPDKATIEHTLIPAVEALSRKDYEGAQNLFRIALQVLLVRAVNRVILASDELRGLLPPDDPLWRKCIDPTDALARSTVEYAQSIWRGRRLVDLGLKHVFSVVLKLHNIPEPVEVKKGTTKPKSIILRKKSLFLLGGEIEGFKKFSNFTTSVLVISVPTSINVTIFSSIYRIQQHSSAKGLWYFMSICRTKSLVETCKKTKGWRSRFFYVCQDNPWAFPSEWNHSCSLTRTPVPSKDEQQTQLTLILHGPVNLDNLTTEDVLVAADLSQLHSSIVIDLSMEVRNAKTIDRNKILAQVAQRRESEEPKGSAPRLPTIRRFKRFLLSHSAAGSSQRLRDSSLLSEPVIGEGIESSVIPTNVAVSDVAIPHTDEVVPEDVINTSTTPFCPEWNVKVGDSVFTREVAIEMMSNLLPEGDRVIVDEVTSEVLSYDGYDHLAKLLATHHGMVRKLNHESRRVKELITDLEKETTLKFETKIALDKKIAEVDRLTDEISKMTKSLTLSNRKIEEAERKADEAEKARMAMAEVLLDHWLDGYNACRQDVVSIAPTFDISCLVPPSAFEFISVDETGVPGSMDPAMEIDGGPDIAAEDVDHI